MSPLRGDPVDLTSGATAETWTDLTLNTSDEQFRVTRSFTNSDVMWADESSALVELPKPFGTVPGNASTTLWSDSLYSFVNPNLASTWLVATPDGTQERFGWCQPSSAGGSCWASLGVDGGSSRAQLKMTYEPGSWWDIASFTYMSGEGHIIDYSSKYVVSNDRAYFFLTHEYGLHGELLYTVNYALPDPSCPHGQGDGGILGPYVSDVAPASGAHVRFQYEVVPNAFGTNDCVPQELQVYDSAASAWLPVMDYHYRSLDGGAVEAGGLLASAIPADAGHYDPGESYSYTMGTPLLGSFSIVKDGLTKVTHTYDSSRHVTGVTETGAGGSLSYTVSASTDTGSSNTCGGGVTSPMFSMSHDGNAGDDVSGTTTLTECLVSPMSIASVDLVPQLDNVSCSGAACSSGQSESDHACGTSVQSGTSPSWYGDRRGSWNDSVYGSGPASTANTAELSTLNRGASSYGGTDFQDSTSYTYTYDAGFQQVLTETKASATGGSSVATTTYTYSSSGRLASVIKSGYTAYLDTAGGSVFNPSLVYIGTFYFNSHVCGGSSTPDPLDRVLEVHGPCYVSSPSATDCASGAIPITQYEYYGYSDDGGSPPANGSGLLSKVTRYVDQSASSCSGGLSTTYDAYGPLGDVLQTTDVQNGIVNTYAYDTNHHVLTSAVNFDAPGTSNFQTTTYAYDNDKLTAVKRPSDASKGEADGYEVYCYRSGTSSCTGTWTGDLMWKAKSPNANGSSPWEKVVYTYWPDGTVKTESYYSGSDSTPRRVVTHAADAEVRPVFDRWGDQASGSSFTEPKLFDGAGNQIGIGLPFNGAGALCQASGSFDPKCAALSYDRINRLTGMQYPIDASTSAKTCFTWGDAGAYLEVRNGCNTTDDCTLGGASGGCTSEAVKYVYDDFGNVIDAELPWTSSWGGPPGHVNMSYDAMGNVLHHAEPTSFYPDAGVTADIQYFYDTLGRETSASTYCYPTWGCTSTALYSKTYDAPSSVPSGCPTAASALSYGRVYSQTDTFGTTYYKYDVLGNVIAEYRDRTGSGCDTSPSTGSAWNDHPNTTYAYDYRGDLLSIDYPYGRTVQYAYDGGWGPERVASVWVSAYGGSTWTNEKLLDDVRWEPYGGLRAYQIDPGGTTSNDMGVEYALGGDSTAATTSCPTTYPGTSDHTGLLKQIDVSTGALSLGTVGDILSKTYAYKADQVMRIDTCLGSTHQYEGYDYDRALRLVDAGASGMNFTQRNYSLDTSNRRLVENEDGQDYHYTYSTSLPDQLTRIKPQPDAGWEYNYTYWNDGQVATKETKNDSSGDAAMRYEFLEGPFGIDAGGVDETVYRSVSLNGVRYDYFYDSKNRRRYKQYPSGIGDEYFYDSADELLVDQGNSSYSSPTYYTEDDYVWLGGRPVVIFRGNLAASTWARASDATTSCGRMGDVGKCGEYFPVSDHIGKVVVMLDSARNVVGTGEYDPFGQVNRVGLDGETAHPYSSSQSDFADFVPATASGMTTDLRVKLQALDVVATDATCGGTSDEVRVVDKSGSTTLTSVTGLHSGTEWTAWVTPSSSGVQANLSVGAPQKRVSGACTSATNTTGIGAIVEGYEYRRYTSGTTPFFTPLRFPGQYHDEETDLNQNWNRFYDPLHGGYLGPEPIYTDQPDRVMDLAAQSVHAPYYGYALGNPIKYGDSNGCGFFDPKCTTVSQKSVVDNIKDNADDVKCHCYMNINSPDGKQCFDRSASRAQCQDPDQHCPDLTGPKDDFGQACASWCAKQADGVHSFDDAKAHQYEKEDCPMILYHYHQIWTDCR